MEIEFVKREKPKQESSMDIAAFRFALRMVAESSDDDTGVTAAICELYECLLDAGCPVSVITKAMKLFNERNTDG